MKEKIKKIREQALYSQSEFAKVLDVSISTIQAWEQGKAKPSFKMQRKLRDFCNQNNIDYIL